MKSNRILQLVLLAMIVVFVGVAGFLYAADSRAVQRQKETTDAITKNQAILTQGLAQKTAKEKEASDLAAQLASAKLLLAKVNFPASAESIEYDRILFSTADGAQLQITNLSATASLDIKEKDTTYQLATFTVAVEGKTPTTIFKTTQDSAGYISTTVKSILDFVDKVATGSDFITADIPSVSITAPEPMTDAEVSNMNQAINSVVRAELTKAEIEGMTEDQIAALVGQKLAAKTPEQVQALLEQVGLTKPSAIITIKIWTFKGG